MNLVKPKLAKNAKIITSKLVKLKEWRMDPKGYILIRIHKGWLEVGFCKKDNIVHTLIIGETPEQMYYQVLKEKDLLSCPEHWAYMGLELGRAQAARDLGLEYIQDEPLKK